MVNRAHPRYAVAVKIGLVVGKAEISGRTENFSAGGLCAEIDRPLPLGEGVVVRVSLVFPKENLSEPLELGGRIVWSTPIDSRFQVGVQFKSVDPAIQKDLDLFLRYLAASPD